MTERIIIAGAGGQGVMLLGKVMAEAAALQDNFVTWLPAYGAVVRGGTAHCMVVISDKEIGSPYIDKADTLIILNAPSLEKFKNRIKPRGLVLINSSLISQRTVFPAGIRYLRGPFTEIANKLGNLKVANMVALGFLLSEKNTLLPKVVLKAIEEIAPPDKKALVGLNRKALEEGMKLK